MTRPKAAGAKRPPAAPKPFYPNIVPLTSYRYDPGLACPPMGRPQDLVNSPDTAARLKPLLLNPVYGIYQGRLGDATWVAEGGFLWQYMHDFCGGILVTSAWTAISRVDGRPKDVWGANSWCRHFYAAGMGTDNIGQDARRQSWATWGPRIPSIDAFVKPGTIGERGDLVMLLQRSVGAAMITLGRNLSRYGLFVGDRTVSPETAYKLECGTQVPYIFATLPRIAVPARQGARPAARMWDSTLIRQPARFGSSCPYTNPNTGRSVAMSWAMIAQLARAKPRLWKPNSDTYEQIVSGTLDPLFPQGVFLNH